MYGGLHNLRLQDMGVGGDKSGEVVNVYKMKMQMLRWFGCLNTLKIWKCKL